MAVIVKPIETEEELRGKAYVHWKAWHEAYAGLIPAAYLDTVTEEKCLRIALRWPDNLLSAKDGDRVIGFAGYGSYRDDSLPDTGEIFALYVLREYYGTGAGRLLMEEALRRLNGYSAAALWVLGDNRRAIRFYEKCGFAQDGTEQIIDLGAPLTEIWMIRSF